MRRCVIKINVPTNTYGGWRDIVASILPSRAGEGQSDPEPADSVDRFTAPFRSLSYCETRDTSQRYEEVDMIWSLIWLAFIGLISILYVKKLWILDKVFGLGTADPLMAFGAITSHLVVPLYLAKRGFENVVRIIKR